MPEASCRACRGRDGQVVLDLGDQPASDHFPLQDTPGPDPVYPLQMWLCLSCGLAQLLADSTVPEEPRGVEPAALVEQATDAIARVHAAGWLRPGMRVMEHGSPHGGSWMSQLEQYGLSTTSEGDRADIVLDCFGLMHAADQTEALAMRAALVAPRGVLLLQYHSLATILRLSQWNSLRHGHYAYYSTTTLIAMLAEVGLTPRSAWEFDLYGGTVLLAASRTAGPGTVDDESIRALLDEEAELGVRDPASFQHLQESVTLSAEALHDWLTSQQAAGMTVIGYGAASRAVALLCRAGIDQQLLMAVADASPAKHGRRMPGTDIPVVSSQNILDVQADAVLLFLPDLLNELRGAFPEIESMGRRWVSVEDLA